MFAFTNKNSLNWGVFFLTLQSLYFSFGPLRSEKSENIIVLDPFILNRFSLFTPNLDLYQTLD